MGILGTIGQGAVIGITIKGIDEFSGTFKKAGAGVGIIATSAAAAVVAVGLFTVAMYKLGESSVEVAAQFEQTNVAFTTMLGSEEKAQALLKELTDFAKKTPFTLTGIEQNAKQLMAMGIETEDMLSTLKSLGDVSAGLSVPLNRLALNYGQVKVQGKLTGRELRDFSVAGVPLIAELSKNLGETEAVIKEMVTAGDIGFPVVEEAFRTMSSEGGKFFDLMDKQSDTFNGKVSNITDSLEIMQRELGTALLPTLKELADEFLNNILPSMEPLIPLIGDFLKKAVIGFKDVVLPLIPKLVEMSEEFFKQGSILLPKVIQMFKDISPTIVKIIDKITKLMPLFSTMSEMLFAMGTIISITIIEPLQFALSLLEKFLRLIGAIDQEGITQKGDTLKPVNAGSNTTIIKPVNAGSNTTIIKPVNAGSNTTIINIDRVQGLGASDLAESLEDELNRIIRI